MSENGWQREPFSRILTVMEQNRALEKYRFLPEQFRPWRSYLTLAIWKTQATALSKAAQRRKL
jgi:3-methyladenine DNA glycosylase/8-oxoguanine DNA glycosylase